MILLIKKRKFSWSESYDVLESDKSFAYRITAELKPKKGTLFLTSRNGVEVGSVVMHKTLFSSKFEIYLGPDMIGSVKKNSSFGVTRYMLDYNRWRIFGNILGWEYDIIDDNYLVMHAGNEDVLYDDYFVLDISYENNEVPILLVSLAMEAANHLLAEISEKK